MTETYEDARVTYTLRLGDRFYIVEDVPARVCRETGEEFFSPQTVQRLQELVQSRVPPIRTVQAAVYRFAA